MILIEVQGGDAPRYRLEFHPRLTVVAGLDGVQRKELANTINRSFTGTGRRLDMTVDIGGRPQHLTYDTLLELGMEGMTLDNIVWPSDAPGAVVSKAAVTEETVDPDAALAEANARLAEANARVAAVEERLSHLATPPEPVDEAEFALAVGLHERAQERARELQAKFDAKTGAAEVPLPVRLEQAIQVRQAVEQKIKDLHAALVETPAELTNAVSKALEAVSGVGQVVQERQARTAQLAQAAGDWHRLAAQIARLESQPRPPEWLIVETKDALDEATAHVKALAYQRQQGIEVDEPLARARQQLADAQAAWDEIEHGIEGQLVALQERQEVLYRHVVQLVGREIDRTRVEDELAAEHQATQSAPHPGQPLIDALRAAGIEATTADAAVKATAWLESLRQREIARPDNQRALAAAMLDLREVAHQVDELQHRIDNPVAVTNDGDAEEIELNEAIKLEREAAGRVASMQEARDRLANHNPNEAAKLQSELREAKTALETAQRRVDYFAKQAAATSLKPRDLPAPEPEVPEDSDEYKPWWAGGMAARFSGAGNSADAGAGLDVYLLSRAARLRMLVRGESVPLIIDSVMEQVDPDTAVKTLEALAKVGAIVQVVYLAGNDVAEKWAKKQDLSKVAVVHLERA